MSMRPQYNQQAEPEQSMSKVEKMELFTKTWKVAIYILK